MTEEMTGKPYEAGDLSKEIDSRVKGTVASFCGKDEYEFGDLSQEIDRRVKDRVSDYIGKDEYEFGDITREVEKRRREWVKGYLGEDAAKNYKFGDLTMQALKNISGDDDYQVRIKWFPCWIVEFEMHFWLLVIFLTAPPPPNLLFSQFGDLTKKFVGNIFGKKKLK